jgi:hypothetical protein
MHKPPFFGFSTVFFRKERHTTKTLGKKIKTVKEFLTVFFFFELVFSAPFLQNTFFWKNNVNKTSNLLHMIRNFDFFQTTLPKKDRKTKKRSLCIHSTLYNLIYIYRSDNIGSNKSWILANVSYKRAAVKGLNYLGSGVIYMTS